MRPERSKLKEQACSVPGHPDRKPYGLGVPFDPSVLPLEFDMIQTSNIDEIAQRLAALVPTGLKDAREDLNTNFRAVLQSGLSKLDLVTREEFDVQRCVLLRTREKIEELERQVARLESALSAQPRH